MSARRRGQERQQRCSKHGNVRENGGHGGTHRPRSNAAGSRVAPCPSPQRSHTQLQCRATRVTGPKGLKRLGVCTNCSLQAMNPSSSAIPCVANPNLRSDGTTITLQYAMQSFHLHINMAGHGNRGSARGRVQHSWPGHRDWTRHDSRPHTRTRWHWQRVISTPNWTNTTCVGTQHGSSRTDTRWRQSSVRQFFHRDDRTHTATQ